VQQDKVVAIRFHPRPRRRLATDLIERIIPPVERRPLDPEADGEPASLKPTNSGRNEKEAVEIGTNFTLFNA
jgi:hypothetical protein